MAVCSHLGGVLMSIFQVPTKSRQDLVRAKGTPGFLLNYGGRPCTAGMFLYLPLYLIN